MNIKSYLLKFQNVFFFKILERELAGSNKVLDVGCGNNSPLGHLKRTFYSEGIDIYKKAVSTSKKNMFHDSYKLGNIKLLNKFYNKKCFDVVVAIDVVEHLIRPDALKLISMMENIARKKVVLLTPNGYIEQDAYDGNPYQIHRSGWTKKELQDLGYRVYGMRGFKYLRNDQATIKYSPWVFWGFLAFITEVLLYPFPDLSFDLFAVKSVTSDGSKNKTGE